MSAFLFNAWVSQIQKGSLHEWSVAAVLVGAPEPEARVWYEDHLVQAYASESPVPARIEHLVSAPFLPDWLGLSGPQPANWAELIAATAPADAPDSEEDWEAGFWVDCDEALRGTESITDADALRAHLAADIRDGLNWNPARSRHLFLSVLKPAPPASLERQYDDDGELIEPAGEPQFPGMVERVAAVVVQAPNALLAGWLWRRHMSGNVLASLSIRVECPAPVYQWTRE